MVEIQQFSHATHPYWRDWHKGNSFKATTRWRIVKDVGFFDMFVKPTLFNIHKFDHCHPLVPSRKKYYAIEFECKQLFLVAIGMDLNRK